MTAFDAKRTFASFAPQAWRMINAATVEARQTRTTSHACLALALAILVSGCCNSQGCAVDKRLRAMSDSERELALRQISDQELLAADQWALEHSHPPSSLYTSAILARGRAIVPLLYKRVQQGSLLLRQTDYDRMAIIKQRVGLPLSKPQSAQLVARCRDDLKWPASCEVIAGE